MNKDEKMQKARLLRGYDESVEECSMCDAVYIVQWRRVHIPGAGSAADWLALYLPCGHAAKEKYDDNRFQSDGITEVL